ncbi:unnamed protein product, partial [Rotaria magnacalcarata]
MEPETTTLLDLDPREEVEFAKPSETVNKGDPNFNLKKDKKPKPSNLPRTRSQTKPVTPSVAFDIHFDNKKKGKLQRKGINISPKGINLNKADSTKNPENVSASNVEKTPKPSNTVNDDL